VAKFALTSDAIRALVDGSASRDEGARH
jgi:hypothetical protein